VTDTPSTTQRPLHGPGNQAINATVTVWAQIISELVQKERFDTFFFFPTQETAEQIRRFATEVVPAARDRVAGV
jgi:hypothetical protein